MKTVLRVLVFVFIALHSAQYVMKAFDYGSDYPGTFILVWLSISALYFLVKPILKIILLPSEGLAYAFLLFALTSALLYIMPMFLQSFSVRPTSLSGLIILGYVLPSKDLTSLWAAVFSAFIVSAVYTFLQGLCSKK
jgi:hypothetical protein